MLQENNNLKYMYIWRRKLRVATRTTVFGQQKIDWLNRQKLVIIIDLKYNNTYTQKHSPIWITDISLFTNKKLIVYYYSLYFVISYLPSAATTIQQRIYHIISSSLSVHSRCLTDNLKWLQSVASLVSYIDPLWLVYFMLKSFCY